MFIKETMWRWDDCWVVVAGDRCVQFAYEPIIKQWNFVVSLTKDTQLCEDEIA